MRATLLGHASWLIEAHDGTTILTDPVLSDPFEEGTVTACPAREIDLDALPRLDALFLSHRHLDHYHLDSLARLPRELPVFCAADPLLRHGLGLLGFADLRTLTPFGWHRLGGMRLLAVPSLSDTFEEYGLAFVDDEGVLLNQVDTPLSGEHIAQLQQALGRPVDVHLAMFACQDFTYFEGRRQDLAEIHATNLSAAIRVGAQVVVPGAAGFRFVDALDWLNAHLFPISRERFATDLQRLSPRQHPLLIDPGDVLSLAGGQVRLERQAAAFVRMTAADTHRIAHDPTAPIPPLEDDNEAGYPLDFLRRLAEGFVGQAMPALVQQAAASGDEVVGMYLGLRAAYRLEVVFPDGGRRAWTFRFDQRPVSIEVDGDSEPHVRKVIAASALADVAGGRRGCFWMRTRTRRSSTVFALQAVPGEGLAVEEVDLRDLLTHLLLISKVAQKGEPQGLLEFYGLLPTAHLPPGP